MAAPYSSGVTAERAPPPSLGMYKLEIELKRGHNLAVRDRGGRVMSCLFIIFLFCSRFLWISNTFVFSGSSDPYVKFKLAGKEVFRSKTIHKNLNPVWDEKMTLILDSLSEPLYVKVKTQTQETHTHTQSFSISILNEQKSQWRFFVAPLQVFDYDFGLQDDFMGSAYLYLESLEQQR